MVGVVVGAVVVVAVGWAIGTNNSIKVAEQKVKESLSGIDVALTKRYDVLTKMLDVVKGYKEHEKDVLTEIVSLRSGMSMSERKAANGKMDELMSQIKLAVENYPELRSNTNFLQLQTTIADVEEHLQAARRLYNANVTAYNSKLIVFPNSLIANAIGAKQAEFFEAEEAKRQDVSMKF